MEVIMKHSQSIMILLALFFFAVPVFSQTVKAPQKTKELTDTGQKSYDQNCATCHGANGNGDTPTGKAVTPRPPNLTQSLKDWPGTKGDPLKLFDIVTRGVPNTAMMGWSQLPEKERWGLVYYLMGFARAK
jgi:mono/diheme cytochrome c family protein